MVVRVGGGRVEVRVRDIKFPMAREDDGISIG